MLIGKFYLREDGKTYLGEIIGGLALFQAVEIVPTEKKGQGPDYVIATPHGELGAAWTKTSKAGKAYLSVKLDSPFLPEPVNCALIKQQDGSHNLVWNRKVEEEQAEAAA
jgi:uncharacterized protein (DUF736 family)